MDLSGENQKREEFRNILRELAKSQIELQDKKIRCDFYKRLENLYYVPEKERQYRHFYSDIFGVLAEIKNGTIPGDINILGQNLSEIRKGYRSRNTGTDGKKIDISASINKLYDHVNLDIARIMYTDAGDWKISGEKALADVNSRINILEKSTSKISNQARQMQKEYITILGIFASILVAFFSGLGFSSSLLANIEKASIYRLILGILLLGAVLFNILGLLINFIREMVDHDSVNKWIIGIGNVLFILLLILVFVAWKNQLLGCQAF